MSYILDALKKLERKKEQDAAPTIMTIHTSEMRKSPLNGIWPYIVVFALVFNAVIIAAWLHPWESNQAVPLSQTPYVSKTMTDEKSELEIDYTRHSELISPTEKQTEETLDSPDVQNNDSRISPPAISHDNQRETDSTIDSSDPLRGQNDHPGPVETETGRHESGNTQASMKFLPEEKDILDLRNKIRDEISRTHSIADTDRKPVNSSALFSNDERESLQDITEFSQLPESTKKALPPLSISGHIYSDDPSRRVVNINGNILREGEEVSTGLIVDEITSSGVIFTFRNNKFRIHTF